MAQPFDYLEETPAPDAPFSDNPSGLYCPSCRRTGVAHCGSVDYCGGMRRMRLPPTTSDETP